MLELITKYTIYNHDSKPKKFLVGHTNSACNFSCIHGYCAIHHSERVYVQIGFNDFMYSIGDINNIHCGV